MGGLEHHRRLSWISDVCGLQAKATTHPFDLPFHQIPAGSHMAFLGRRLYIQLEEDIFLPWNLIVLVSLRIISVVTQFLRPSATSLECFHDIGRIIQGACD